MGVEKRELTSIARTGPKLTSSDCADQISIGSAQEEDGEYYPCPDTMIPDTTKTQQYKNISRTRFQLSETLFIASRSRIL